MDFNHRMVQPLPFYMTYPGYFGPGRENTMLRDMEYFQQMYPDEVKRYQRRVAEILDKMDYEGSMIYDEYPDRYSLQRLMETILQTLQAEDLQETQTAQTDPPSQGCCKWRENLVQILLCNEICRRRHGGRRTFFAF